MLAFHRVAPRIVYEGVDDCLMPSMATTSETRSLKNWVPLSLCIWSQTPNRGKISVISLSTTTCALALRQRNASNHLVKQSETVSMYLLPFFDLGKRPTKSMLIFWKG
jgi:hypothetical protein